MDCHRGALVYCKSKLSFSHALFFLTPGSTATLSDPLPPIQTIVFSSQHFFLHQAHDNPRSPSSLLSPSLALCPSTSIQRTYVPVASRRHTRTQAPHERENRTNPFLRSDPRNHCFAPALLRQVPSRRAQGACLKARDTKGSHTNAAAHT